MSIFGDILGPVLGYEGTRDTNKTNQEIADQANQFNTAQTAAQMDFQKEMSNTAYQRAVKDMQAAGLNPMLAYHQGGAHAPQGSAATATIPQFKSPLTGAAEGLNTAATLANIENVKAQTRKTSADAAVSESMMRDDSPPNVAGDYPTKSWPAAEQMQRSRQLHYQVRHELDKIDVTQQQLNLIKEEIKNAIEQRRNIQAHTRDTIANAVLRELQKNEAEASSKAYGGPLGDTMIYTRHLGSLVHSAGEARAAFRPNRSTTINRYFNQR